VRLILVALALAACHRAPSTPSTCAPVTLVADRAPAPLKVDGTLTAEEGWLKTARTRTFVDATSPKAVVAFTEVRALWDDAALYLAFYSADEDLRADDWVGATFANGLTLRVNPAGKLTCSGACDGAKTAVDTDGTIDKPEDEDEEWVVELVVPWSLIGGKRDELPVAFDRNEVARERPLHHLVWNPGCADGPQGTIQLR
jgi:hypothetical protein